MKINIESSLPEIWIRIRFHNGAGPPSLVKNMNFLERAFSKLEKV
jgi:hypothetical protein